MRVFQIRSIISYFLHNYNTRGRRGRHHIVVEFTTTYAISAHHQWCCEFESRSGRGVLSMSCFCLFVLLMVPNATFNNVSVISWRSVLLVEDTGIPGKNHRPVTSHWQTILHNVASSPPRLSGIRSRNIIDDRHVIHLMYVM
jgi:hypothetical protein